ncbi:hypothetical protein EZV62_004076 [Acer yangbiense]|uniref:Integrase catalytic domain-containing protein n=1 Tax=Acer yangbiense TaxID=1000413 RepID=A0A5C7IJ17_9ROSI|nr:hypothetical protein EZV62_004076 [Acer yangbiense]
MNYNKVLSLSILVWQCKCRIQVVKLTSENILIAEIVKLVEKFVRNLLTWQKFVMNLLTWQLMIIVHCLSESPNQGGQHTQGGHYTQGNQQQSQGSQALFANQGNQTFYTQQHQFNMSDQGGASSDNYYTEASPQSVQLLKSVSLASSDVNTKHCTAFTNNARTSILSSTGELNKFDVLMAARTNSVLWHAKLGHPAPLILKRVLQTLHFPFNVNSPHFCDSCKLGKLHRLPYKRNDITAKVPLELIYSDIWGPAPILSNDGYRYYIVFVDAYTRYSWVYPLHLKSEALSMFIKFQKLVELQFDRKIKMFQADMGGEYLPFVSYLSNIGVHVRFSCPYTHQQNGVPERKHRSIVEMGLTLLAHANLPFKFWFEAFSTAVILINNLPSALLGFISPFERLFKRKPNYNFFKVFGSSCFPYLRNYSKHKFDYHTSKCVFIGYSMSHKGYRCLHPSGKVFVSRNVVFNEMEFPYKQLFGSSPNSSTSTTHQSTNMSRLFDMFASKNLSLADTMTGTGPTARPLETLQHDSSASNSHSQSSNLSLQSDTNAADPPIQESQPISDVLLHPMTTRSKNGIFRPKTFLSECILPSESIPFSFAAWIFGGLKVVAAWICFWVDVGD